MRKLLAVVAALVAGIAAAVALADTAPTTGTNTSCATATTPAHTVGVDGTDVTTIPGDTATQCHVETFTIPTSTETVTVTTPTDTTPTTTTTPAPPPPANAPVNTAQPAVTGGLQVGQTLTTTDGSWSNGPDSFTYRWEDCNPQGMLCSVVSGATGKTYTLAATDSGSSVRSIVAATNTDGSASMYSGASGIATSGCTQTFTSANKGTSPYPGSNINNAIANAAVGSVFCLSDQAGEIDLYKNPLGRVYIEPAPGVARSAAGAYFNVNGGAGGSSHITIQNLTGSFIFYCAQGPTSCNITGDQALNNALNGKSSVQSMPANTGILIARNTFQNCAAACAGGLDAALSTDSAYAQGCPNGVTIAHNLVDNVNGDGIDDSSTCGTQIVSNVVQNILQNGGNCSSHCDGWQETGSGRNIVVDGNLYQNVSDCWADLPNSQGQNLTITNNVCSTGAGSFWAQFTSNGMTFKHNTVVSTLGCQAGNALGGPARSLVFTDSIQRSSCSLNSGQSATGSSEDYNLCSAGSNFSCGNGAHDITGPGSLAGGSSPSSWAGFQLTAGSPGHAAADDGTDMGVSSSYFAVGSMTNPSGLIPGPGG